MKVKKVPSGDYSVVVTLTPTEAEKLMTSIMDDISWSDTPIQDLWDYLYTRLFDTLNEGV